MQAILKSTHTAKRGPQAAACYILCMHLTSTSPLPCPGDACSPQSPTGEPATLASSPQDPNNLSAMLSASDSSDIEDMGGSTAQPGVSRLLAGCLPLLENLPIVGSLPVVSCQHETVEPHPHQRHHQHHNRGTSRRSGVEGGKPEAGGSLPVSARAAFVARFCGSAQRRECTAQLEVRPAHRQDMRADVAHRQACVLDSLVWWGRASLTDGALANSRAACAPHTPHTGTLFVGTAQKRDMDQSAKEVTWCWEDAGTSPFQVRGIDYMKTKVGAGRGGCFPSVRACHRAAQVGCRQVRLGVEEL